MPPAQENVGSMGGNAQERHGLFRCGAFVAAPRSPLIDPETFAIGDLPPDECPNGNVKPLDWFLGVDLRV